MASYVKRPRIVPDKVEERDYQVRMADGCCRHSTLLILPTGLGKTIVALYVAADVLEKGKKVMVLAPTKPLVDQHYSTFASLLVDTKVGMMTGNLLPEKRAGVLKDNDVIVATPQAVANDLTNGSYDLRDFGLVIYDEAHRGTGDYAYVTVAEKYKETNKGGLSMGMTASPGSERERLDEICVNLSLSKIDMRSEDDPDVSPYTYNVTINRIELDMPQDLVDIVDLLNKMLDDYVNELINLRALTPSENITTKRLLIAGKTLQFRFKTGERSATLFRAMSAQSMAMKISHAIVLAETQGVTALRSYLEKFEEGPDDKRSKGAKEIVSRKEYKEIIKILGTTRVEHPKISRVMSLVSKEVNYRPNSKVIVFSHYRNTCDLLVEKLSSIDGVSVGKLIGQSAGGLKQKEQTELLRAFRDGTYNVIVATSVGEEGLDVTSTDLVIFYENVPSEIRTIQRRGRTGRKNDGVIYVLTAKGTRDEAFEEVSKKKEETMVKRLKKMRESVRRDPVPKRSQKDITKFE